MLIGADLLNLDKLQGLGAPVLSIGGAGAFDGIFVSGMMAVLLAGFTGGGGRRDELEAPPPTTRVVMQEAVLLYRRINIKIPDPPHCGGGVTACQFTPRHWWSEANPSQLSSNSSRPNSR